MLTRSRLWGCLSLVALTLAAASAPAAPTDMAGRDALYQGGMANLQVLSRYMPSGQRSRMPTLQAILHRVVYEPDQATPSEIGIATAILTGQPVTIDDGAKGMDAADKLILNIHFKPLAPPKAPPAQVAATVKPVTQSVNKGYTKIATAGKSVTYTAGVMRKPGGVQNGYVAMKSGTRPAVRIVEIPTASGDLGVATRAQKIATRLSSVQKKDPTWWNRITPGTAPNGEAVVSLPHGAVPWILTADRDFAREWNTSPDALAGILVTKIRSAIDSSGGARGVLATPAEEAIQEKEAGDDAYAKGDLATAEQDYKQAIQSSPGYVIAYKLLIGVYKEQKMPDEIKALVVQAQGEPSLKDDQIKEIEAAAEGS